MSDAGSPEVGSIGWIDITIDDAEEIRNFYGAVVGWKPSEVSMGDYSDFTMNTPETGTPTAGVCHARGTNVGLPRQWLLYIVVADLDRSLAACAELGGSVVREARDVGSHGRYAVIRDPAGAVCALLQPAG